MPLTTFFYNRSSRLALFASIVLLILQSCANTPFGKQLANNFESDDSSVVVKKTPVKEELINAPSASKPSVGEVLRDRPAVRRMVIKKKTKKLLPLLNPQPYRITIKLSKADPAAPAEAVTKALRMAGVSFEVEMIERVNSPSPSNSLPSSGRSRP